MESQSGPFITALMRLVVYGMSGRFASSGGSTVGEVLKGLTSQFGDLRKHLYSDEGKLRSYVNVYLNDEDIRYLDKEASAVKEGDTISIVPSPRATVVTLKTS